MNKKIGVLGCGWLGLPLAKHLVNQGHQVSGTTTSAEKLIELEEAGIVPFQITLEEQGIQGAIEAFLENTEVLILNIPPKLRKPPYEDYTQKIRHLKKEIISSAIEKVIFVSSTSVYGDMEGEVTEETPPKPVTRSGKSLLESEQLLFEEDNFETTVIRFAGLIGDNRHPITFLSGRKNLTNGDELINLIHREDCIGIISQIIEENYWGKIVNGVFPFHPKKRKYYQKEAKKRNLQPPEYTASKQKIVRKTVKSKNFLYNYLHPVTTD